MPKPYDELLGNARDWALRAVEKQWLRGADIQELSMLQSRSPGSLFEPGSHRPLVAAFFGGTGVGKSSLLNRLAGQPVARTGVERPTSREVSVYLHDSIGIGALLRHFPLEQVRVAQHHDDAARQIMWVDMPDIDSVERHNRELVLQWLPHIDVLIYVVSPERYSDDKGWRLLLEHGGDHAWLFILNQWDRGQSVQFEDFQRLLGKAGFQAPVVLRTDCRPDAEERRADDFAELRILLGQVADRHVLNQLETRAEQARFDDLRAVLEHVLERLGVRSSYAALQAEWDSIWHAAERDLLAGLEWPMQTAVAIYTGREANPLTRPMDLTQPPQPEKQTPGRTLLLWDEWAEGRVRDAMSQLLLAAGDRGLPILPLKAALETWPAEAGRQVLSQGQLQLRQSLARPGNSLQRSALKIAGLLSVVLPLGAICWAAYQVVKGYYESAMQHLGYLGTDFAVHSLLLIGLAWLLPWFIGHRLKPSVEKSALNGLRAGVSAGLIAAGETVAARLAEMEGQREHLIQEATTLLERSTTPNKEAPQTSRPTAFLARLLPGA